MASPPTSRLPPALASAAPLAPARGGRSARGRTSNLARLGWAALGSGLALALVTTNPLPTAAALLSLALIVGLLFQPGQPPVLAFICFMQWLQAAALVFYADALGVELYTLSEASSIELATYLSLGWVSALALGAAAVVRRIPAAKLASATSHTVSVQRLTLAYLGFALAMPVLSSLAPGSARQLVVAANAFRYVLIFALVVYGWTLRRGRLLVSSVLLFEIMTGFLAFFSEFKTPLFVLALALLSLGYRPNARQYLALGAVFCVTLYLGVIWSAIKLDYRQVLSGGEDAQRIVASTEEQIETFLGLVGSLDQALLAEGAEKLVLRLAYVEYFALTLDHVPRHTAHEDGRLWGKALMHVLMPRLLFPDKPILESDTVIAERYTGVNLGSGKGTSISLGVPAETYVDVGYPLMFAVALLLGALYGLGYRSMMARTEGGALAQGAAVALHLGMTSVGAAAPKVLGGYLTMWVVFLVAWRVGWRPLQRWIRLRPRP